jgi:hypothetical protein
MPGSTSAPVSEDGEEAQEGTDDAHTGHEVEDIGDGPEDIVGFIGDPPEEETTTIAFGLRDQIVEAFSDTLPEDTSPEQALADYITALSGYYKNPGPREADGEMEAIDDETDLDEALAAGVNRPPVGDHDGSDAPDLPKFVDPCGREEATDD